ncbi:hypothetical protein CEXT_717721 [Caerostris extrusa]|uniref:Uncharacterized protein n=1 Tax=Caerostris extrusa TaxID=172846 RepID=A0AAV4Q0J8_CAEEX|nr:hypothetical protein CEXT_717721 [Caerostris extrusa]
MEYGKKSISSDIFVWNFIERFHISIVGKFFLLEQRGKEKGFESSRSTFLFVPQRKIGGRFKILGSKLHSEKLDNYFRREELFLWATVRSYCLYDLEQIPSQEQHP